MTWESNALTQARVLCVITAVYDGIRLCKDMTDGIDNDDYAEEDSGERTVCLTYKAIFQLASH